MLDTLRSLVHFLVQEGSPKAISQFLVTTGKERALSSTSSGALEGSVETSYPHSLSTPAHQCLVTWEAPMSRTPWKAPSLHL